MTQASNQHDPRTMAHIINALHTRQLIELCAGPDANTHHFELRRAFVDWVTTRAALGHLGSWQQAWNEWIGPAQRLTIQTARCTNCNGRRYDARSPGGVCRTCMGTAKGQTLHIAARPAVEAGPTSSEGE